MIMWRMTISSNEENAPNIKKFIAIKMQRAKVECGLLLSIQYNRKKTAVWQ
jgi:hypothetical protein